MRVMFWYDNVRLGRAINSGVRTISNRDSVYVPDIITTILFNSMIRETEELHFEPIAQGLILKVFDLVNYIVPTVHLASALFVQSMTLT